MNSKRRLRVPRSRATQKKPKFLSLRRQFPPRGTTTLIRQSSSTASARKPDSQQLNLFPLEPQNPMENQEHENVACFFSAADCSATTLTGLLLDNAVESNSSHVTNDSSRPDDLSPSASLTYADRRKDSEDRAALERNALRTRERESSEEKWVCYSKVVERKVKEEEVSSSVADLWQAGGDQAPLSLKLDYEDIVKAWSGRGPLYINYGEATQIVPDITDDILLPNNGVKAEGSVGTWTVPEMVEEKGEMRMKKGQREASVLRYKAKRQNRLFSKKIRYQVRKLNAEKRPRIKGRFVKRG